MFHSKKKNKPVPKSLIKKTADPSSLKHSPAPLAAQKVTDEITQTTQMIQDDVASAVATLKKWLNQDTLH